MPYYPSPHKSELKSGWIYDKKGHNSRSLDSFFLYYYGMAEINRLSPKCIINKINNYCIIIIYIDSYIPGYINVIDIMNLQLT